MLQLTNVLSTFIDAMGRRLIKFARFGNDTQETFQAGPYGVDSNPIAGMVGVYGATSQTGKPVIIGYINKNQIAEPGEYRTFATDNEGNVLGSMYFKSNGDIYIQTAIGGVQMLFTKSNNAWQVVAPGNVNISCGGDASITPDGVLKLVAAVDNAIHYKALKIITDALAVALNANNAALAVTLTSILATPVIAPFVATGEVIPYVPEPIDFDISPAKNNQIFTN